MFQKPRPAENPQANTGPQELTPDAAAKMPVREALRRIDNEPGFKDKFNEAMIGWVVNKKCGAPPPPPAEEADKKPK